MSNAPAFLRSLEEKWKEENKPLAARRKLRYYYKNRKRLLTERYNDYNPRLNKRLRGDV